MRAGVLSPGPPPWLLDPPGALALAVIILATTSRAWTSMVQMVMIFILSPALRFPISRVMSAFSWLICGSKHASLGHGSRGGLRGGLRAGRVPLGAWELPSPVEYQGVTKNGVEEDLMS